MMQKVIKFGKLVLNFIAIVTFATPIGLAIMVALPFWLLEGTFNFAKKVSSWIDGWQWPEKLVNLMDRITAWALRT